MVGNRSKRFTTPHIVQPGGQRPPWMLVVVMLLLALWSWQVFDLGRERAGFDSSRVAEERGQLKKRIEELEDDKRQLQLKAATHERAAQIDSDAAHKVQEDIHSLQNERSALKREVAFLRRLVSEGAGPLYIKNFRLESGGGENSFHYRFTVAQVLKGVNKTKGEVQIKVSGTEGNEKKDLTLKELTAGKQTVHKLGFKHYQDIEGRIETPASFKPKTITIEIKPKNRKLKALSKVFEWKVVS